MRPGATCRSRFGVLGGRPLAGCSSLPGRSGLADEPSRSDSRRRGSVPRGGTAARLSRRRLPSAIRALSRMQGPFAGPSCRFPGGDHGRSPPSRLQRRVAVGGGRPTPSDALACRSCVAAEPQTSPGGEAHPPHRRAEPRVRPRAAPGSVGARAGIAGAQRGHHLRGLRVDRAQHPLELLHVRLERLLLGEELPDRLVLVLRPLPG